MREVRNGHRYLSPPLSDRAIEVYEQMTKAGTMDKYETLTTREREVLHLSAEGCSNSEIAVRLGISVRTAETHRSKLMHKLGVHSQADLIRYALRRGIFPWNKPANTFLNPLPSIDKYFSVIYVDFFAKLRRFSNRRRPLSNLIIVP